MNVEQVLSAILSTSNERRQEAEAYINDLKSNDFLGGIRFFMNGIQSQNLETSQLAALLLKKKFLENPVDCDMVSKEVIVELAQVCKAQIGPDRPEILLKRIADILATICIRLKTYDDLMNFLDEISDKADPENKLKTVILYFIEVLSECALEDNQLKQYSGRFVEFFRKYLTDESIFVKVKAMKTMSVFLASINDESFVMQFKEVFQTFIDVSIGAIQKDEEAGICALNSLSELSEIHPNFVKNHVNQLIDLMNKIISVNTIPEAVRSAALQNIVALATNNGTMTRKSEAFKSTTILAIMNMLAEVDNESQEEWLQNLSDKAIQGSDPASIAQDALTKISPELGAKYCYPKFLTHIQTFMASNEWKHKYAALNAINCLIPDFDDEKLPELKEIMNLILNLNDSNIRVVYAAMETLRYLCAKYSPEIQNNYHQAIMNLVLGQMQVNQPTKIQQMSLGLISSFCRDFMDDEESAKILLNYVQPLLRGIHTIFDKGLQEKTFSVIEEALNSLSMIANILQGEFAQYYNDFMPGLKQLLINFKSETPEQTNVKVLTIETIGFLVCAVKDNASIFEEDSKLIMNYLVDLHNSGLANDDAHHSALLSVYTQFAENLKDKFLNYLPFTMEKIFNACKLEINFDITDQVEDDVKEDHKIATKCLDLGILGGKKTISLNSVLFEHKISGWNALPSVLSSLNQYCRDYAEKIMALVKEHLNYPHSREIRSNAVKVCSFLLKTCQNEQEKAIVMNNIFEMFLEQIKMELQYKKIEEIHRLFDGLNECFKLINSNISNPQHLNTLNSLFVSSLQLADQLKNEVLKEIQKAGDIDQTEREELDEEYESYNDIYQIVMELSGHILKHHSEQMENIFVSTVLPFYHKIFSNKKATESEILYAICQFDEIIFNCSQLTFDKAFDETMKNFKEMTKIYPDNVDIQQSIVFGFGVLAQRASSATYQPHYDFTIRYAVSILEHPEASSDDRIVCTECAVGAIGKIGLWQGTDAQGNEIINKFLTLLPLKNECEEAQNIHKLLFKQIIAKHPRLMNHENAIIAAINNIKETHAANPSFEILDEEGVQLAQSIN